MKIRPKLVVTILDTGEYGDKPAEAITLIEDAFNGRKGVRAMVHPATPTILRAALREAEPLSEQVVVSRRDLEALASKLIDYGVDGTGALMMRMINSTDTSIGEYGAGNLPRETT